MEERLEVGNRYINSDHTVWPNFIMEEETKPEEKPQTKTEEKVSFIKEIRVEREALEKVRDENKAIVEQLREIKAIETISGTADAGQAPEPPKEETAKEYKDKVMSGQA